MSTLHTMTDAKRIAYLEGQIAKFKQAQQSKLSIKVSKAGAVSVYGLQRWPVTLYRGQWERLLTIKDNLLAFIEANSEQLASKED